MTEPNHRHPAALVDFPARYAETSRFSAGAPRTFTVTHDGGRVLFCRSPGGNDNVLALWSMDVNSGVETLLFDPRTLGSADDAALPAAERARRERAREAASGVVSYSIDDGGSTVCCAIAGSLFVVDLDMGAITSPELTGSVFDPRLSPDGSAIAYVDGRSLSVIDTVTGEQIVSRLDDDPLVSHGRAEFIAAEEMQRSRGFWWAPDSSALLVTRVDENPVDQWWIAEPAHPDRTPTAVRYPGAGTANAAITLELVKRDGTVTTLDWSEGGRYEYLTDVIWSPGNPALVVRQTRDQRLVSVGDLAFDGGPPIERNTITDEVWVELIPGSPSWCAGRLLTIEDLWGARRLCVDNEPITDSALQVRSLVGVLFSDEEGEPSSETTSGIAILTVWLSPSEIGLVAVSYIDDEVRCAVLSPRNAVSIAQMAAKTLVVSTSSPDRPGTAVEVFELDYAKLLSALISDQPDPSTGMQSMVVIKGNQLDPGFAADPTFTVLGARELQSAVFLPSHHNGSDPLPIILDPYGGPHAQRVLQNHDGHLVSRWLAEHGYAVIVTDGRGTPGRGPEWEREVYGNLAGPALDDQVAAVEAACARYSFLDPQRVGIRGWSFGGYLAALAVLRRPERFHAAVAGAPVTTWRLYDTHYTERYLGHPAEMPEHYRISDVFVPGEPLSLTRPLLVVHGLADDNVVAAHTLRLSSELLANGCPHEVLPLSGVTHMTPQVAVAANLLRLQLDFFDRTIGTIAR